MQNDFIRFKDKLSDFSYGGRSPIPRGPLERADRITTKNLLIDIYGEETALDVTIKVFKLISLMRPAEDLQHNVTQHGHSERISSNTTLEDYRLRYVDYIKDKYHVIEDHNARLGEAIKLERRFTSLLLIKKYRDEEERQHEITCTGQRHLQILINRSSDEYCPTTIQALFDSDEDGIIPKIVVLQGPAGIGKTMTSQKIMLDWASGNLYKDQFNFVFYMSCREVNTIICKMSLARYLSNFCGLEYQFDLLRSVFINSKGILFIVDGFDELKWSSVNNNEVCEDPFQEISKETLLNSLFRKKMLNECSIIITTRPFSLMKLKDLVKFSRYVEIIGFSGCDREKYFYNFFKTKEHADLALSTVKDNDTLFTMCAVPITCWILCTVMKPLLKEGLQVIDSKTSTSIYLLYLKSLIKYHGRTSAQSVNTCIKKLCTLANEGVWDNRILFEESDLVRHGLSMSELESAFLNENIFHRDIEISTCYSFIHLSVQEFFAALYYVLDKESVKEPFVNLKIRKAEDLLEASMVKAHLKLTVRFLFGLSSEKQIQETQRTTNCTVSFREKPVLEEWLRRNPSENHNEILCCLYETQDKVYVERMMSHFLNVKINGLFYGKKSDQENIGCRAVAYCLETSTIRHIVSFEDYILGPKARNVLSTALSKCAKLCFRRCRFPDTEEDLNQAGSSLSGLFQQSQMQELKLKSCGLKSSCCDDLRSVIITNRSLIRLKLTRNNLEDSGVKLLCEGLRHPACTLQDLRLGRCDLTSACCDDLRSVVILNRSLVTLDLSWNNLEDPGIKFLCEGLSHPNCTLQELTFSNCGLTSSCCDDLRSVIIINRSLIRLNLSCNDLQDSGVKLLCDGLRHPSCTLQELALHYCDLTSSCCDDLLSVLITNHSLIRFEILWDDLH
ncbi:NACHT, LRR and PYD domains-containing protein 3-like isoform X2 [Mixophyes fleayi]|uniref:NACHT, LRR and PYD domains-containing protein 3-like isoform X2 n=1 Tax=Mixophyes fleayi TaxID=3061075 RepID=UPI003F4E4082